MSAPVPALAATWLVWLAICTAAFWYAVLSVGVRAYAISFAVILVATCAAVGASAWFLA